MAAAVLHEVPLGARNTGDRELGLRVLRSIRHVFQQWSGVHDVSRLVLLEDKLFGVGGGGAGRGTRRLIGLGRVADVVLGDVKRRRYADGADHVQVVGVERLRFATTAPGARVSRGRAARGPRPGVELLNLLGAGPRTPSRRPRSRPSFLLPKRVLRLARGHAPVVGPARRVARREAEVTLAARRSGVRWRRGVVGRRAGGRGRTCRSGRTCRCRSAPGRCR